MKAETPPTAVARGARRRGRPRPVRAPRRGGDDPRRTSIAPMERPLSQLSEETTKSQPDARGHEWPPCQARWPLGGKLIERRPMVEELDQLLAMIDATRHEDDGGAHRRTHGPRHTAATARRGCAHHRRRCRRRRGRRAPPSPEMRAVIRRATATSFLNGPSPSAGRAPSRSFGEQTQRDVIDELGGTLAASRRPAALHDHASPPSAARSPTWRTTCPTRGGRRCAPSSPKEALEDTHQERARRLLRQAERRLRERPADTASPILASSPTASSRGQPSISAPTVERSKGDAATLRRARMESGRQALEDLCPPTSL